MSNIYNHSSILPSGATSRISELLEALKNEFDAINQDVTLFKVQREELEHKLSAQLGDLNSFQKNFIDLENAHLHLKRQYEEEIIRLKKELERNGSTNSHSNHHQKNTLPPPNIGQSTMFENFGESSPRVNGSPSLHSRPGRPNQLSGFSNGAMSIGQNVSNTQGNAQSMNSKRLRSDPDLPQLPGIQTASNMGLQNNNTYRPSGINNNASFLQGNGFNNKPKSNKAPLPQVPTFSEAQNHAMMHQRKPSSGAGNNLPPQRQPQQTPTNTAIQTFPDPKATDKIPPSLKREGQDWFAIFHPKMPRTINLDLISNFDHNSVVCCVKFSSDGKYLATGCNRIAQIYDVDTFEKICELIDDTVNQTEDLYIRSVCFSPDGKYLATGAEDKLIRIWDISRKEIKQIFQGHSLDIYSLDFSADGKTLVSGSGDSTARIWDMETGKSIFTLSIEDVGAKDAGVTSVAISPDGRLLVGGSLDYFIRIWDIKTGYLLDRLEGHTDSVYSVAFTPDGKYLVSGSLDQNLKLWEVGRYSNTSSKTSTVFKNKFEGHKDFVLSVAASRCGNWIVSGSKDRGVHFWDPRTGQAHVMLQGHKNSVISVALNPKRNIFATGSGDCRARLWSYENIGTNQ